MGRIAIVGIGCRYAGGIDSAESFWNFVVNKGDGVVEVPADRWNHRRFLRSRQARRRADVHQARRLSRV